MAEIDVDVPGAEGDLASAAELRRRVRELAAVYRMADAAASARTLEEILDEAVDALVEALGVDRASILLRDGTGTMRFRAWRGLSDAYRAAVDGHSPWTGREERFDPIVVPDVAEDPTIDHALRETILGEGIRALAFVPLVHGGALLGKFMLYSDRPRAFTDAELRLGQTIASTIAGATQRAQAEHALRESQSRLDAILREVADGITVQIPDGTLVFANDAAARLLGAGSADELLATPLHELMERFELLDDDERPLRPEELPGRRALAGEEVGERVVGYRVRATGELRWSVVSATPVRALDGRVQFAVNVFRDVTDRRRQEQRLAFLARAGETLARSLDYSRTLAAVARLAVPTIGDWAMVYVQEADGRIRRLAVEHVGGLHEGMLEQLEEFPFDPDAEIGVPAVIRSGEPQLHAHADSRLVAADVVDGERLAAAIDGIGIRSWMCVPLTAGGRTFGAMSFLATDSGRTFDEDDLDLAGDLARRAAAAVDNARLYEQAQQSFALLDAVLASAPVGIGFWDADIRYVRVNDTLAALNGIPAEDHVGKTLWEVIPDLAPVLEPVYRQVVETGEPLLRQEASTDLNAGRLGHDRHWLASYFPVNTREGDKLGVGAVIIEITERKRAEDERDVRARQQADVSALGQLALSGVGLDALMEAAVAHLAQTLDVEYAKVLELLPDGTALRLRAGVGWQEGLVGGATVGAGLDSQAGYTLSVGEPVVVEDLPSETRFTGPPLLHGHGVVSGMSVVIRGREAPWGVLGIHTQRRRAFTRDDVNYLQAVSNVLAAAVDQWQARELERAARERLRFLAEASRLLSSSLDYEATLQNVADLASHTVADWATVTLLDDELGPRRLVGWHRDPERHPLVARLVERYPPNVGPASPLGAVLAEGRGRVMEVSDELLEGLASDGEHLELLRALGLRWAMVVPIAASGGVIGALSFASESDERAFGEEDLAQAEELGRRAGLAIENARLYQATRYQSELTRTITENATSALFMMDERGHPTYMNRAAEEMTGFVLDEIRDRPLHYTIHHSHPDGTPYPMEECPIDRALPEERTVVPYEDVFVRKDGTFFPVRAAASPIHREGRPVGTVVEVHDITAEKAAERERLDLLRRERDARREAERRAQAAQALEFVGDGVFMVDRRGVVRLWNPAAEAITGLRQRDVVGRMADRAIPGWADLASRVPIVETSGGAAARAETLPLEVGGRELWVSISGVGFQSGTVFAFRDVTEERGVEKLKSDFVSTISHELRTPLAAIYGAALTLARKDTTLEPRQQSDLLGVIAAESERLARIVNDILWTSRIESGGLQLTIEAFDPVELVTGVVHAFEISLPANVAIRVEAEPGLPSVAADPDKVRQVLTNLVENAIKYSPDGGTILVAVERSDGRVRFAVADRGLGIPAREAGRIFEKFYRLDPNLTRGVGGTGLGLYICRELVNRMGGRIWVESEEGRGSTFVAELPAADDITAHARR